MFVGNHMLELLATRCAVSAPVAPDPEVFWPCGSNFPKKRKFFTLQLQLANILQNVDANRGTIGQGGCKILVISPLRSYNWIGRPI